tara:strand:- start:354 stop:1034 length:681 start_codon:yes stop_codon:yes gene_type:complete
MRGLNVRGQAKPGENQKEKLNAAARSTNVRQGIVGGVGSEGNKSTYGSYSPNVVTVSREKGIDATSGRTVDAKKTYSIPSLPSYKGSITQSKNTTVSKMSSKNTGSQTQSQFQNYGPSNVKPSTHQGKSRDKVSDKKPLPVGKGSGYQKNYVKVAGSGNNQIKTLNDTKTDKVLKVLKTKNFKDTKAINKQKRDSTFSANSRKRTQLYNELTGRMSYLAENNNRKL